LDTFQSHQAPPFSVFVKIMSCPIASGNDNACITSRLSCIEPDVTHPDAALNGDDTDTAHVTEHDLCLVDADKVIKPLAIPQSGRASAGKLVMLNKIDSPCWDDLVGIAMSPSTSTETLHDELELTRSDSGRPLSVTILQNGNCKSVASDSVDPTVSFEHTRTVVVGVGVDVGVGAPQTTQAVVAASTKCTESVHTDASDQSSANVNLPSIDTFKPKSGCRNAVQKRRVSKIPTMRCTNAIQVTAAFECYFTTVGSLEKMPSVQWVNPKNWPEKYQVTLLRVVFASDVPAGQAWCRKTKRRDVYNRLCSHKGTLSLDQDQETNSVLYVYKGREVPTLKILEAIRINVSDVVDSGTSDVTVFPVMVNSAMYMFENVHHVTRIMYRYYLSMPCLETDSLGVVSRLVFTRRNYIANALKKNINSRGPYQNTACGLALDMQPCSNAVVRMRKIYDDAKVVLNSRKAGLSDQMATDFDVARRAVEAMENLGVEKPEPRLGMVSCLINGGDSNPEPSYHGLATVFWIHIIKATRSLSRLPQLRFSKLMRKICASATMHGNRYADCGSHVTLSCLAKWTTVATSETRVREYASDLSNDLPRTMQNTGDEDFRMGLMVLKIKSHDECDGHVLFRPDILSPTPVGVYRRSALQREMENCGGYNCVDSVPVNVCTLVKLAERLTCAMRGES
jgi:hypothetical protein